MGDLMEKEVVFYKWNIQTLHGFVDNVLIPPFINIFKMFS